MPNDKPVFWHQGLFLQPQHFQATDLFHQYRLQALTDYSLPYFWGLQSLTVDEAALTQNVFLANSLAAVFPGALPISYPDNAILSGRSFKDIWTDRESPLNVYVGLKRWDPNGRNVTEPEDLPDGGSARTMYCSPLNPEAIHDFYTDGPQARVRRLTYVLQIFFEEEIASLGNYHLLQIARIVQSGDRISLSDRYAPPCLNLSNSPLLKEIFDEIRARVIQRCQQLSEFKNPQQPGATNALDAVYIALFLALRSLNRCAARLHYLAGTSPLHPWAAYGALFEVLAELSSFDLSINALGHHPNGEAAVPPYDHERLWTCFSALREQIYGILDGLYIGPDFMMTLIRQDGRYRVEIPEPILRLTGRYWLVIRSDGDLASIEKSILNMAKIGSENRLSALLARALPGLPLMREEGPPAGVPRQKNALYFRLETNHPLWDEVVKSGKLAMYWDQAPEEMTAQLVMLKGMGGIG